MDLPSAPQDPGRRLVIGIGNPGEEYDGTRHNVGFAVLDLVARQRGLVFGRLERGEAFTGPGASGMELSGRVKARIASAPDGTWHLVKPLTYVNGSGIVVGALARAWAIPPHSIFVVSDDLDLPLGRIRIRPSGSSGGHRGLLSIEHALATRDYPRLRLGIGRPDASSGGSANGSPAGHDREASVDHVLSRFAPEERQTLEDSLSLAAQAVSDWLGRDSSQRGPHGPDRSPMDQLMSRYNTPKPAGPKT